MWKNYSLDYIKNNRGGSISVIAASFIAALFLSLLCSLFYDFWLDNIEGTKLEDGDWHGRITGKISEENLVTVNHFANVERAVINESLSEKERTVIDIYFYNKRTAFEDMSLIAEALGSAEYSVTFNYQLLSLYFIRIPGDDKPRLIMPAYLAIVTLVCISLILIIHNSFAVSMNSRIHQFGIFSSIGATPAQIRTALVQEALALSLGPILAGLLTGLALSFGIVSAMSAAAAKIPGGRPMDFGFHPAILGAILLLSLFTVLVSAYLPAGKLSRLTPLEAIRGTEELWLKKKKNSPFLSALFGTEGELAGASLKAQKKALRTTSLSLTLAFLGFMLMQCFFTLSGISTNHTYFERYQDVWDVMITVKDTAIENFKPIEELQNLSGSRDTVVYQKAEAKVLLPADTQSPELLALGGLKALDSSADADGDTYFPKACIVIMDDKSFAQYCSQIDAAPGQKGTVLVNRIWDSTGSNFRYPKYIPYVREDLDYITLQSITDTAPADALLSEADALFPEADALGSEAGNPITRTEIPVLAYTQKFPALREEYDNYALVNFIPLSLWTEIKEQLRGAEKDTYVRLLAQADDSPEAFDALEENALLAVGTDYTSESENRIEKKIANDKMIESYELLLGGFCAFLAVIGVAHVFSNTLGFLRQRKREFARYQSIGLTLYSIRKLFCIEALVIVGKPVLVSILLTTAFTALMIKASYLAPMEFIVEAPILPISLFVLTVFGFVALAYYLGGKKILKGELAEALRDDTLM